jgi:hypothetical protein
MDKKRQAWSPHEVLYLCKEYLIIGLFLLSKLKTFEINETSYFLTASQQSLIHFWTTPTFIHHVSRYPSAMY